VSDTRLNHALNHVAISMPAKAMDAAARADIHRFYGEVFGWSPYTPEGEPGNPLVMLMGDSRFYLYISDDEDGDGTVTRPMVDHLGIEVAEERELDEILSRARAFKEKDDRVTIVEKEVTHHTSEPDLRPDLADTGGDMVNCYIGYVLPLQVEIQHFR
jgi:hypothetical protein